MKKLFLLLIFMVNTITFAQVGIGTNTPNPNAILDISSTTKGLLIPRLTTVERTALGVTLAITPVNAEKGMQVFDTDTNSFWFWNGSAWVAADTNSGTAYTGSTSVTLNGSSFERAALTGDVTATANGNNVKINAGAVGNTELADNSVTTNKIQALTIATGDLANNAVTVAKLPLGSSPTTYLRGDGTWVTPTDTNTTYSGSTTITVDGSNVISRPAITGDVNVLVDSNTSTIANGVVTAAKLNQMAATSGQVLKWNGSAWAPSADTDTDTNTTYTGSTSVVLNGTSFERAALSTGDVTAPQNSNILTIANGAVTAAKLNQMAATSGQVLKWNGTAWAPAADTDTNTTYTGSTSVVLNGTSFERAALTGDVTATANGNGTTIAPGVVTAAKMSGGVGTAGRVPVADAAGAITYTAASALPTTNIYNTDGTLTGNRTITMGGNTLSLNGGNMLLNSGNLGIGAVSPTTSLAFGGDIARSIEVERRSTAANGRSLSITAGGAGLTGVDRAGGNLNLVSGISTGTQDSAITFQTATPQGTSSITDNTPTTKMTILGNGNVGIGTVPTSQLHTTGGVRFETLTGTGSRMVVAAADGVLSTQAIPVGTVTSVGVNSPILNSGTATAPVIGIISGGPTSDGFISSIDWNTFNSKEPAITAGTTTQYWSGTKTWQTLNTDAVPEGVSPTRQYFTNARARAAISLTTSGSGAATYSNVSGILNIPTPTTTNTFDNSAINAFVSNVNGVVSSFTPLPGTLAGILGFNSSGQLVRQLPSAVSTTNIYSADGTLAGNRIVTQGANTLAFTSTAVNGFSVDGTTFSVDATNNRIGLGTATPATDIEFGSNADKTIQIANTAVGGGKSLTIKAGSSTASSAGTLTLSTGNGITEGQAGISFNTKSTGIANAITTMMLTGDGDLGLGTTPLVALEFGSEEDKTMRIAVSAAGHGKNLTIAAGDAAAASTNRRGGDLRFESGAGTGQASNITFYTAAASETVPTYKMILSGDGKIGLGDVLSPTADIEFDGYSHKSIAVADAPIGAGKSLTIKAGDALFGAGLNAAGGDLILSSGATMGVGEANIIFKTAPSLPLGGNAPETQMVLSGNGNLGIGTSTIPTTAIEFGAGSDKTIQVSRQTNSGLDGQAMTIMAGAAKVADINRHGGTLILSGGISTGAYESLIEFRTATPGASGTADRTPSTKMKINGVGKVSIPTAAAAGVTTLSVVGLPTYADNAAAAVLSIGDFYRTPTGVVMVRY